MGMCTAWRWLNGHRGELRTARASPSLKLKPQVADVGVPGERVRGHHEPYWPPGLELRDCERLTPELIDGLRAKKGQVNDTNEWRT
jgi:hypothetical protein